MASTVIDSVWFNVDIGNGKVAHTYVFIFPNVQKFLGEKRKKTLKSHLKKNRSKLEIRVLVSAQLLWRDMMTMAILIDENV